MKNDKVVQRFLAWVHELLKIKGSMFFCLRTTQGEKVIPLIAVRIGHFHDDVTWYNYQKIVFL